MSAKTTDAGIRNSNDSGISFDEITGAEELSLLSFDEEFSGITFEPEDIEFSFLDLEFTPEELQFLEDESAWMKEWKEIIDRDLEELKRFTV